MELFTSTCFIETWTSNCYLLLHCIRLCSQWHLYKNDGSVWQFDKLQHCQEMASWVPEWSYRNCGWTMPRMTECVQRRFDQYGTSFNQGKCTHNLLKSSDTFKMWLVILCRMEQLSKSSDFALAWEKFVQDGSWHCWIMSTNGTKFEHKWNQVAKGLDFMYLYHARGENLFDQIVIGYKKWVHHFTPEMKNASKQWLVKGDNCPVEMKRERLARKIYTSWGLR